MTRIFAAVSLSVMLLITTAAVGAATTATSNTQLQTELVALLGSTLGIASVVPLVLVVGLLIAGLGVMASL